MRLKDIALRSGVSIKTVSRAINNHPDVSEKTKKKILKIAEESNYVPNSIARGFRQNRTYSIGYIVRHLNNQFFVDVGFALESRFRQHGYSVLISFTGDSVEAEVASLKLLLSKRVDGIILSSIGTTGSYVKGLLDTEKTPIVLIDNKIEGLKLDGVFTDNVHGSYLLTKHLIEHGHRNIACINGPTSESSSRERLLGYKQALRESGISVKNGLIKVSNWQLSGGFRSATEVLEDRTNRVSAIFVTNYLMALGTYRALRRLALRVPQDIAVVCFEDIEILENIEPGITALHNVDRKIGEASFELLYEKIKEGSKRKGVTERVVEGELCIRESCGCRRAGSRGESGSR